MKNILISCISLFPGSPSAQPYTYKAEDITISATQTNEACFKFLVKKLGMTGETLDHYICVQSSKVEGSGENAEDSDTMKYLYKAIGEFCGELNLTPPAFFPCPLGKDESEHRFDRILSEISKKVLEIADSDEERRVAIYLDMAGGKRDNYVFIQLLTKLLSFYGFDVHAYYADIIDKEKRLGEIVNTDASFVHMKILDAVNEFIRSGSATALRNCFDRSKSRTVKDLLKVMEEFSDAIQLCHTNIGNILLRLDQQLTQTEKYVTDDSEGLFIVKTMIPLIRSKFNIKADTDVSATLGIVKWCLDNNLIQQALTIYRENAADIIMSKKLVELDQKVYGKTINKMMEGRHSSKRCETELFCILGEAFQKMYQHPKAGTKEAEDGIKRYKDHNTRRSDNNGRIVCRDMEWTVGAVFFSENFLPNGVKLNINTELFRKIVSDYRFATSARNRVNHASEKDNYSKLMISLFSLQSYPFSSYPNTFTPKNVKKDLLRAVNNLEDALKIVDAERSN